MNADNLETLIAVDRVHGVERIVAPIAFKMFPSIGPSSLDIIEKRGIQSLAEPGDIFRFLLYKSSSWKAVVVRPDCTLIIFIRVLAIPMCHKNGCGGGTLERATSISSWTWQPCLAINEIHTKYPASDAI